MTWIVVDVEADGPCPGLYSMISFGAVVVDRDLDKTFYGQVRPITDRWEPKALEVVGVTRDEHERPPHRNPADVMFEFEEWVFLNAGKHCTFISDNPAFDWQWINYYFHRYVGRNPFGFSARRIGDLYCGLVKNVKKNNEWKRRFRHTKHTHHPVDDAKGNAEALLEMKKRGLNIPTRGKSASTEGGEQ